MEPLGGNTADPSWSDPVSTKLERIATLAKQMPEKALFTLNHCLDRDLLLAACIRTRKDGAVGIDGQTYEEFREELFERLDQLVDQAHQGTYRAPPVRRVHIPKGGSSTETFDLLGFTWYWGRTRTGGWTVKTQTAASRVRRTITRIDDWCRRHRHDPIPQQQTTLSRKLWGHYNYYARRGNYYALSRVYRGVLRAWRKWLSRRSWKAHLTWGRFEHLLARHPLPLPRIRVKV